MSERAGRRAETMAAWWLRFHGWSIVRMRARCPRGEVDIVARRGKMLAFVEVKARRNFDEAGFALEGARLKRVAAAAEWLFHRMARPGEDMRIDAILIVPHQWPRHLVDIWRG